MEFLKINNRKNFLLKEVPIINPHSRKYISFWREQKRRCISGIWSIDDKNIEVDLLSENPEYPKSNSWRYMPPVCYFYVNFGTIMDNKKGATSGAKIPIRPRLDDIEWEFNYNWLEARGFSGFIDDNEYSCNVKLLDNDLDDAFLVNTCKDNDGNILSNLHSNFFKKNGDRKKYIDVKVYLRKLHNKPLGDPIYANTPKNMMILGTRDGGKSYLGGSVIAHELIFDGMRIYEKNPEVMPKAEIIVGAAISDKSRDLLMKAQETMDNLPGGWKKGSADQTPSPFFKHMKGSLQANKEWKHEYSKYNGGEEEKVKGSFVKHRVFTSENAEAAAGGRPVTIIVDEVGLMTNLLIVHGTNVAAQNSGGHKFGSTLYTGTAGNVEKIEESEIMFNDPVGFDMVEFDNIWEEESVGKIGWFIPATHMARSFKDVNGNTMVAEATRHFLKDREKKGKAASRKALDLAMMNYPLVPSEMFVNANNNLFPVSDIKMQYAKLLSNKSELNISYKGHFSLGSSGEAKWTNETKTPIREYPLKKSEASNINGCIEIFEMPVKNDSGVVPSSVYIAGCLTPGEMILTNNGIMKVEDVGVNDKLINIDGDIVNIINFQKYNVVNEDTYKIKVANTYRKTNFTKEHPILSSKRKTKFISYPKSKRLGISQRYYDFNFDFIKSEELTTDHWLKVPNTYKKKIDIDFDSKWNNNITRIDRTIENPLYKNDFWWFIGMWIGDGWCESNDTTISMSFNKKEYLYIERFKDIVKKVFNRKVYERESSENCIEASFSSKQLNKFLNDNFGKYSYGKKIPEWVKYIKDEDKFSLIQGYLDSDGCITTPGKYYNSEFVSVNLELLESFQDILFSVGIISSIKKLRDEAVIKIGEQKESKTRKTFSLILGHYDTINLYSKIEYKNDHKLMKINFENLPTIRRNPKNNCHFDESEDYIYMKVLDIEKSKYTGIVYNFECDTHTFMCKNIPTHNCDPVDDDDDTDVSRSLQSFWIMNSLTGRLVLEYTGRTNLAADYYEQVRRSLLFYNAKLNYENNKKGLHGHMYNKAGLHMLSETPEILMQKDMQKSSGAGNKGYGTNMQPAVIKYGEELLLKWLIEQAYDKEPGVMNLHTIKSPALLKELISYSPKGNFDRISALFTLMILKEDKIKLIVAKKKKVKTAADDPFFSRYRGTKTWR